MDLCLVRRLLVVRSPQERAGVASYALVDDLGPEGRTLATIVPTGPTGLGVARLLAIAPALDVAAAKVAGELVWMADALLDKPTEELVKKIGGRLNDLVDKLEAAADRGLAGE